MSLLSRLPGHARCASAGADSKALIGQPRLEDAANDFEGSCLDNAASDWLAATDADVDDTLKCERKSIGGMLVKRRRVERGRETGQPGVGG